MVRTRYVCERNINTHISFICEWDDSSTNIYNKVEYSTTKRERYMIASSCATEDKLNNTKSSMKRLCSLRKVIEVNYRRRIFFPLSFAIVSDTLQKVLPSQKP